MDRRTILRNAAALSAWGALAPVLLHAPQLRAATAEGTPFDRAWLEAQAKALAARPYVELPRVPAQLGDLSWDDYQAIRFDRGHSLWADSGGAFQVQLFHLGLYFQHPVEIAEVLDGVAYPVAYAPGLFDTGPNRFDPPLPADLGFAGFRVHFHTDFERDVAAFLGASYFRAVGGQGQYGMSARGLAIDTGLPRPEEFPMFTHFWLERPAPDAAQVVVHALLDSPSVAGAYTFVIRPGDRLTMEIDAALYPRAAIERLGIAPLTSMFQHGENDRRVDDDFRPEIHDSDGLSMWTGAGEWIWRPLLNPGMLRFNAFLDDNPHGFGLLQRDRDFDHYQDDGVYYDRRPCVWIEPLESWGRGAIQLVEIPTPDETFDNIVAFWTPEAAVEGGEELRFRYRLTWGAQAPVQPTGAWVAATRIGVGGVVGQKRDLGRARKFVIDFVGGDLEMLARDSGVEPVITVSRGTIELPAARPLAEIGGWRVSFDLVVDGKVDPYHLRCFLRLGSAALSETWLYQYSPEPIA